MLDADDLIVHELAAKVVENSQRSWEECVQLVIAPRPKASSLAAQKGRRLKHLANISASKSLSESQVQLGWGYFLTQLRLAETPEAQWSVT